MAGISPEMRWIGPFSDLRFVVDMRLWHHILEGSESVKQQRPGQKGGEVNASRSDRQTHMDCALDYCQSSSSRRPWISHEDKWVMDEENIQTLVRKQAYQTRCWCARIQNNAIRKVKDEYSTLFYLTNTPLTAVSHGCSNVRILCLLDWFFIWHKQYEIEHQTLNRCVI